MNDQSARTTHAKIVQSLFQLLFLALMSIMTYVASVRPYLEMINPYYCGFADGCLVTYIGGTIAIWWFTKRNRNI